MERRNAIKTLGLSLGSLISLPAWASNWSASTLVNRSLSTFNDVSLLAELVDTLLPATDTKGAKDLGVPQFIQTMLTDCYTWKARAIFEQNLVKIGPLSMERFGKPFVELAASQRLNILKLLAASTDKETQDFYQTLRGLTIQGYMSSEYYMTTFTDYEMAPARFYGSVAVKK
jgi:hypothetical protein